MRKPAFCICENKDTDQLCCNWAADQRLYVLYRAQFLYFLNSKYQACRLLLALYSRFCDRSGQNLHDAAQICQLWFEISVKSTKKSKFRSDYTCSAFKVPESDSMVLCVVFISLRNFVESSVVGC